MAVKIFGPITIFSVVFPFQIFHSSQCRKQYPFSLKHHCCPPKLMGQCSSLLYAVCHPCRTTASFTQHSRGETIPLYFPTSIKSSFPIHTQPHQNSYRSHLSKISQTKSLPSQSKPSAHATKCLTSPPCSGTSPPAFAWLLQMPCTIPSFRESNFLSTTFVLRGCILLFFWESSRSRGSPRFCSLCLLFEAG